MPGDVKFEAPVAALVLAPSLAPFHSRIPVRGHTKGGFLAPFWGLIWVRLHSKTSSFLAPEKDNSCVFTTFLGSFPLFSIFFLFSTHFPLPPR
jgi:hypothetical protein